MGDITSDEIAAFEREILDATEEFSRDMEQIRKRREELLKSWMGAADERKRKEVMKKMYDKES
jgi:hypothetical protein